MFITKKAQQAIEFMLILVFVMALIAGAMYVSGIFLGDFKEQENVDLVNNFVANVDKEIDILGKVEGGYYRELEIFSGRYDVNLTADGSLLIIKDKENDVDTYYFDLVENPGFSVTLNTVPKNGVNMTILIFEKFEGGDYDGLLLDDVSTIAEDPNGWPRFDVDFKFGPCGASQVEIFKMDNFTQSHVGVGLLSTYDYKLCLNNTDFNIGNSCSGNYETLFYLGNNTNSHIWLDKDTAQAQPYAGYYNWQKVCISSDGGVISRVDSKLDKILEGYDCIGSYYYTDSTYGASFADCSDFNPNYTKIWVKIEVS